MTTTKDNKESHVSILERYTFLAELGEKFLNAAEEVRLHKDNRDLTDIVTEIINNKCKKLKVTSNV